MKTVLEVNTPQESPPAAFIAVERGLAAAKTMARQLTAEHKRWQMPLLTWKHGQVVKVPISGR